MGDVVGRIVSISMEHGNGALDNLARQARLEILVLQEKQRVAARALDALRRYGRHDEPCPESVGDGACDCGLAGVLNSWRLAAEGRV